MSPISYNETDNYQVTKALVFNDETVVRLVKFIDESDPLLCLDPRIILRHVHRDGSVEKITINYPIPKFNFCVGPNGAYPLLMYRFLPDLVLILYVADDGNYYGLLITIRGEIIRFVTEYIQINFHN